MDEATEPERSLALEDFHEVRKHRSRYLDRRFAKALNALFSSWVKPSKTKDKRIKALVSEASDIWTQREIGHLSGYNLAAYFAAEIAIIDLERSGKRELTEPEKIRVRRKVVEIVKALRRALAGRAEKVRRFLRAGDALVREETQRLRSGQMTETTRERALEALNEVIGRSKTLNQFVAGFVSNFAFTSEDHKRLETNEMTKADMVTYHKGVVEAIRGLQELTGSEERATLFLHVAFDYANKWMSVRDLPVMRAGRLVKQGGKNAHERTYGTAKQKQRTWAYWQDVVNRLHEEDPSRNFKELCYHASKEVRQANGNPVKADTIRHHVRNPRKVR